MANVLMLVHRMPLPLFKGDKLRSYHLLRHLQERHRVFLGTFVDDPGDEEYLPELKRLCPDLHVCRLRPWLAKLRSLTCFLRGEPLTLGYFHDAALQRWVKSTVDGQRIDAVVVFTSAMAPYAPRGIPTVVDFVDVDSAKWTKYASEHGWPMSWVYAREGRCLQAFERAVAGRACQSFFVTPHEAALFRSTAPECSDSVGVLRNGVDAVFFEPHVDRASPFSSDELPLVFTGSMDYPPNIDGVRWFVSDILPLLLNTWPTLRFYIVGRNPAPQVLALASEYVVVSGTVPDVRPYLQYAAAVVAPLRLAGGIQNKILEAMAMAQAVVTVPSCAEAVGASEEQGLIRATDAEVFAEAVGRLLRLGGADARRLGIAAREFVLEHCRWDKQLRPIDRFVGRRSVLEKTSC